MKDKKKLSNTSTQIKLPIFFLMRESILLSKFKTNLFLYNHTNFEFEKNLKLKSPNISNRMSFDKSSIEKRRTKKKSLEKIEQKMRGRLNR